MKKKPKWIIFDVGNVLYDFVGFAKDIAKLMNVTEETIFYEINNLTPNSMEGQYSVENYWKTILSNLKLEHKFEYLMNLWQNDLKYWLSDTKKLMGQLDKAGYNIAILTNNWVNQTDDLIQNLSKSANIKFYFESSVEKLSKPDIKLYKLVEERTNAKGIDILFIDDVKRYLDGAKKLGWQTFLYTVGKDDGKTSNDLIRKQLL